MEINVAQLRRMEGTSRKYVFSEQFSPLQFGQEIYPFLKPLNVELDIVNTGKSLLVIGTVSTEIEVTCSRCLKSFPYSLEFRFDDEWLPIEFAEEDKEESAFIFEKDEFSINDRIFEHILVHIPMRFICSEDCKGLCSKCGTDLNKGSCACTDEVTDPRLEILSKWNKGV